MRGPFYNTQTGVTGERLVGVANDGHTRLVETQPQADEQDEA